MSNESGYSADRAARSCSKTSFMGCHDQIMNLAGTPEYPREHSIFKNWGSGPVFGREIGQNGANYI